MSNHQTNAAKLDHLEPSPGAVSPRSIELAALVLIAIITFLVYSPSFHGTMLWDDNVYITRPELQSLPGLYRIWFEPGATQQYYPLVHSAFWLEHKLWGDSVLGYHVINVTWHIVAVSLLYLVLKKLKVPGAILAAAIFALHPVMVESVAWIAEQKNTLSAIFYLAAILTYLNFDESRRRSQYLMALGLFALALAAKTATVMLPPALLIILWWQRGSLSWRRDVRPLVPFFVMSIAAGIVTTWAERKLVGIQPSHFDLSFVERFLLAGRAVWFYLSKLIWPINLTPVYPRWQIDPHVGWEWIFSLGVLAMTAALWFARKRWRSPLASWLFFCATLFPVLGFIGISFFLYSFVADHFQYIASLGIIVLAAGGIAHALAHRQQAAQTAGILLCAVLVAILALCTMRQSRIYIDDMTFNQATIDRNPNAWVAHYNLGLSYNHVGREEESFAELQTAVAQNPNYPNARSALGFALIHAGRLPEAVDSIQAALDINPDYVAALNNMGIAQTKMGHYPQAIEYLERALRIDPGHADAHNNLAEALKGAGRTAEATEQLQIARSLTPDDPEVLYNLATSHANKNELPQAIELFERALRANPDFAAAHNGLGIALHRSGDVRGAAEHFHRFQQLKPNEPGAYINLAIVATGDEAIQHFQKALELNPNMLPAYTALANALANANRGDEAVEVAKHGIEVAHSEGDQTTASQLEEWITNFQSASQSNK